MSTKRITRTQTSCLFGPGEQPVAKVAPGHQVLFETQDAQAGRVRSHADALSVVLPYTEANPVTGPVYVLGAQPGDTLAVEILDIRLGPQGVARVRPGRGVIGDQVRYPAAFLVQIRDGFAYLGESIRLPVRPMIGTIGTAPAVEPVPSYHPGPHGGNLDINAVAVGATVYLPVAVDGALLSLGDVHASMGDGELTGGGIDIPADVLVRVGLHSGLGWQRPVVETPGEWCTCASGTTLESAIRLAAGDMVMLLAKNLGLSREEAFILVGAAGDARVGQAAQVGIDVTAYLGIDRAIMPEAF